MSAGDIFLVLTSALLVGAVATPLMRRVALRLGILDYPSERKTHSAPVPLLGGLAIYGAVMSALVVYAGPGEILELAGILLGASLISFSGLLDDRRDLSISSKLLIQIVAALLLFAGGVRIQLPVPEPWNAALGVLWVVAITNAFNLIDNVDGLCGGVGAVSAGYFLLLASLHDHYRASAFAAALLGACVGFVIHNFKPARIFMGDSGSLLIGFLLAALGIMLCFPGNAPPLSWIVPVMILGVPILDTGLVVVSRLRRRLNPLTTPGTDHISHRLMRLGWSSREAVLLLYLAGSALGAVAIFVSFAPAAVAYSLAAFVFSLAGWALFRLDKISLGAPRAEGVP